MAKAHRTGAQARLSGHAAGLGLVLLGLGCLPQQCQKRQNPGPLQRELLSVACRMARVLPESSRLVVLNLNRFAAAEQTWLGVALAQELTVALKQAGMRVIDRPAGERAFSEEKLFLIGEQDWTALLAHFRADFAVTGSYDLDAANSSLRILELKACTTFGAELRCAERLVVRGSPEELAYWQKLDNRPLPNMGSKLRKFLLANGNWNVVQGLGVELESGEQVPASGEVTIGSRLKVRVDLAEPCNLYVLNWDQYHDRVFLAFPLPQRPALAGPGRISLPGSGYFRAYGPAGFNWIRAVATRSDLGLVVADSSAIDALALESLAEKIQGLKPEDWGARTFAYWNIDK